MLVECIHVVDILIFPLNHALPIERDSIKTAGVNDSRTPDNQITSDNQNLGLGAGLVGKMSAMQA